MKNFLIIANTLLALSTITSCANADRLTDTAREIKIAEKRSISNSCEVVGRVEGINKEGLVSLAQNRLLNQAAKIDANTVTIDETVTNGKEQKVMGTAYICR
ncbi:MAG: hypothetical protein A2504_09125 [Bdellovibrionales bacterium RIFOXYD12_FULL_39_22]|nr:MAG: hypothetical protein A2385_17425 [Bdellovibrionales bacterium RIFOXYB1_FULL_39_21]OFZ41097.1 MAG: hypothetical protein A2485_00350 [Bdellovibrionales bacterium RIFOXYC12_FULL_39_17]OFZ50310.1 MAG: hypothetical protein A2404_07665 [Bdellovibrionales bacterium RIFOXYC1_FULL_39_130]OFZ72053.1 MAG: hypothetical protein A2451_05550 [Bdellovibrionales bacterium RIFOXYC2_FULL_39_8]OFZ75111.1 MAG: hypothetical protein A2560_16360 [Bdellovibrionales bacterium RIFOXYD1_FULL_39_84]OFZ92247.1 MAG: